VAAVRQFGVKPTDITFLGYPNGPLYRMWRPESWLPSNPARSVRTLAAKSPYINSFTPGVPYCGQSVVQDIETIMEREKPTMIISLHPSDTNSDHRTTASFVNFAFFELRERGVPFT
jgi:LmbE family N-acetylglucosaminyl deacetylase